MDLSSIVEFICSPFARENFLRSQAQRDAEFALSINTPHGVFEVIGLAAAKRVLKVRRRRELERLGDVSVTFETMMRHLDIQGHFFASYVNHFSITIDAWLKLVRDDDFCNTIQDNIATFRRQYHIPDHDSPEAIETLKSLYESGQSSEDFRQSVLGRVPSLAKLVALEGDIQLPGGHSGSDAFDDLGLDMWQFERRHYGFSPVNSIKFASTGGDGTHFSLVELDGRIDEHSPVVMTCPSMSQLNRIVGSDLREFLSLGSKCGYFTLEQLMDGLTDEFDLADDDHIPEYGKAALRRIVEEFDLKPWENTATRLDELQKEYYPSLIFPVNAYWE